MLVILEFPNLGSSTFDYSIICIPPIWSFSKLVNHSNLGNYLIFQILNFYEWGLEFQRASISIGEAENWRTKPKFANFWNQILVFHIEKKIPRISQILQFQKSSNFHYRKTHRIIKIFKLFNFKNWRILKIWQTIL